MSYEVIIIAVFEKQAKRLIKKYPSLRMELLQLVDQLEKDAKTGTPIGKNCFKIRIAIAAKGKGKSGGARVITNFVVTDNSIYLLSIYDKSEKDNLTVKELEDLLKSIPA